MLNKLLIAAFFIALWVVPAHATTDWDDSFEYNSNLTMVIPTGPYDSSCPNTHTGISDPQTGNPYTGLRSLHLTYPPPDSEGGCSKNRDHAATDVLFQRWRMFVSPGWLGVADIPTKIIASGPSVNGLYPSMWWVFTTYGSASAPLTFGVAPQGIYVSPGVYDTPPAYNGGTIQRGAYHCVETEVRFNTPGQPDGVLRAWINNTQVINRTNVNWRGPVNGTICPGCGGTNSPNAHMQTMQFYRQHGNGYIDYDDYAVSRNARIGCGSAPPPPTDTTAPTPPSGGTATASAAQVTVAWTAPGLDAESGYASTNVLMCSTAACTPTVVLTTVNATSATPLQFIHTGLLASTTYSYRLQGVNGAGLLSTPTATFTATTPASGALFRTTVFTDDFNRANNALNLGSNWIGGYSGNLNFQILSQRALPTAVGDALMTYATDLGTASHAITATVGVYQATNSYPGLLVGFSASPTFSGYECRIVAGTTSRIAKWTAGVFAELATTAVPTWQSGDIERCEHDGTATRFYRVRAGAETLILSAVDGSLSGHYVGMLTYANPVTNAQFDDVIVETISSTPPVVPAVTALTAVGRTGVSGLTTTGSPPLVRFYSDFSTIIVPIAEIVAGAYNWSNTFIAGLTNYACAVARTASGSEVVGGQICVPITYTPDTTPPVLSNPQPTGTLPAGTTSTVVSASTDKPCTGRYALTNIPYPSMTLPMGSSGLLISKAVTGLTDNSVTSYYLACGFIDQNLVERYNAVNTVATVTVSATPGDTTPPVAPVIVATARGSSQVEIVVQPLVDLDARGWRTYISIGAGNTTYVLSGAEVPAATLSIIRTGFTAATVVNVVVRTVDTSSNEGPDSNVVTVTTDAAIDLDPPTNASNLNRELFTQTALLTWTSGVDGQGPVRSIVEQCTPWAGVDGVPCPNFGSVGAPTAENFAVQQLTPGVGYCWRIGTVDLAAAPNPSPGYSNTICGMTTTVGRIEPVGDTIPTGRGTKAEITVPNGGRGTKIP